MVITKYSLIGAILQSYPTAQECFQEMGMHCVSCHMSQEKHWNRHVRCISVMWMR